MLNSSDAQCSNAPMPLCCNATMLKRSKSAMLQCSNAPMQCSKVIFTEYCHCGRLFHTSSSNRGGKALKSWLLWRLRLKCHTHITACLILSILVDFKRRYMVYEIFLNRSPIRFKFFGWLLTGQRRQVRKKRTRCTLGWHCHWQAGRCSEGGRQPQCSIFYL